MPISFGNRPKYPRSGPLVKRLSTVWKLSEKGRQKEFERIRQKYRVGASKVDYARLSLGAEIFEKSEPYKEILETTDNGREVLERIRAFNEEQTEALRKLSKGEPTRENCAVVLAAFGFDLALITRLVENVGVEAFTFWIGYNIAKEGDIKHLEGFRPPSTKHIGVMLTGILIYGYVFGKKALFQHMGLFPACVAMFAGALAGEIQTGYTSKKVGGWFENLSGEERMRIAERYPTEDLLIAGTMQMYKAHEKEITAEKTPQKAESITPAKKREIIQSIRRRTNEVTKKPSLFMTWVENDMKSILCSRDETIANEGIRALVAVGMTEKKGTVGMTEKKGTVGMTVKKGVLLKISVGWMLGYPYEHKDRLLAKRAAEVFGALGEYVPGAVVDIMRDVNLKTLPYILGYSALRNVLARSLVNEEYGNKMLRIVNSWLLMAYPRRENYLSSLVGGPTLLTNEFQQHQLKQDIADIFFKAAEYDGKFMHDLVFQKWVEKLASDKNAVVTAALAVDIGRIPFTQSTSLMLLLSRLMKHDSSLVAGSACNSFKKAYAVARENVKLLNDTGFEEGIKVLAGSKNKNVRLEVTKGLGGLEFTLSDHLVLVMEKLLKNPDPDVAMAALKGFGNVYGKTGSFPILEILTRAAKTHRCLEVRKQAEVILQDMGEDVTLRKEAEDMIKIKEHRWAERNETENIK